MALNILVRWVMGASPAFRGVGTWGAKSPPPQSFQKTQKVPFSGGKVRLAFVKNVAQIAFFIWLQLFVLQKTQKMPSLWWQSALCLCENCCSDCILYDCNYFSCPSSVANISGKDFSGALFIPKVPLETGAHAPIFWCFLRPCQLYRLEDLYTLYWPHWQ
jgi:hypothetical protein